MITLKHILVATDFSDASEAAVLYGRNFARAHGAVLHVLHVVGDLSSQVVPPGAAIDLDTLQRELEADALQKLDELARQQGSTVEVRPAILTSSVPARAIALTAGALPPSLVAATVAAEDRRFWWHIGIDPIAIGRALKVNILEGHIVEGGSTISQQIAKLLLNRATPERTRGLPAKVYESVIAREHGFPSWNALREEVDARTLSFDAAVDEFLR